MSDSPTSRDRVFVSVQSWNADTLWKRVDDALSRHRQVWLRSPILERLVEPLGQYYGGEKWLVIKPYNASGFWNPFIARTRDVALSLTVVVAFCPLLLFLPLMVKLRSPGPVFYSAFAVGKDRRRFRWRKFRSMKVVSEEENVRKRRALFESYVKGEDFNAPDNFPAKVIDKSRVTQVGRFLRKYSLDELPQLWNVIRGEMTLVGPRPCLPYEAEFYSGWREKRFEVKPGLTGLWQVFGRGRSQFDEAAAMDVLYLYRRSFRFDLYLLIKTIGLALTARGGL